MKSFDKIVYYSSIQSLDGVKNNLFAFKFDDENDILEVHRINKSPLDNKIQIDKYDLDSYSNTIAKDIDKLGKYYGFEFRKIEKCIFISNGLEYLLKAYAELNARIKFDNDGRLQISYVINGETKFNYEIEKFKYNQEFSSLIRNITHWREQELTIEELLILIYSDSIKVCDACELN